MYVFPCPHRVQTVEPTPAFQVVDFWLPAIVLTTWPGNPAPRWCSRPHSLLNRDTGLTLFFFLVHNGFLMTKKCPPMNRMYYIPRFHCIREIVARYPPETPKDKKLREQNELRAYDTEVKRLEGLGQKQNIIIKGTYFHPPFPVLRQPRITTPRGFTSSRVTTGI
jgi:hypothetical protein